jgi:hypothetical protein
MCKVLSKWKV